MWPRFKLRQFSVDTSLIPVLLSVITGGRFAMLFMVGAFVTVALEAVGALLEDGTTFGCLEKVLGSLGVCRSNWGT